MNAATILYGTESGNSEMVAEDVGDALRDRGIAGEVFAMDEYPVDELSHQELVILITSTYGEGELPVGALPFFEALDAASPNLSSTRFAAFGLGDSTYETFNRGIAALVDTFIGLGAEQIGETGHHDAATGLDASEAAVSWIDDVFAPERA
ncbi:flavodoxin domain-containing protein [Nocardioides luteus]|uniref:flavodoxin domain-containing protein n=1 Tax=Nocardioides luteus TaxID=1844 RepID=UPI0018CB3995|nr:flavodoxin family protein [Nocardioides luteus]MBG6095825.1 MioC protein [Nocardioides luteus]